MLKGLIKTKTRASRSVDDLENDFDIDMLHIATILRINSHTLVEQDDKMWYVNGQLNGVDTSAEVDVLPVEMYEKIPVVNPMKSTNTVLWLLEQTK